LYFWSVLVAVCFFSFEPLARFYFLGLFLGRFIKWLRHFRPFCRFAFVFFDLFDCFLLFRCGFFDCLGRFLGFGLVLVDFLIFLTFRSYFFSISFPFGHFTKWLRHFLPPLSLCVLFFDLFGWFFGLCSRFFDF